MFRYPTSCVLLAAIFAGACATPSSGPVPGASANAAVAAAEDADTMTGSRLKRKSTDRLLKSTDNSSFRRDNPVNSLGNEVGIRGN